MVTLDIFACCRMGVLNHHEVIREGDQKKCTIGGLFECKCLKSSVKKFLALYIIF